MVIAFVGDLIFRSRIQVVAERFEQTCWMVQSVEMLKDPGAAGFSLVLIDLEGVGEEPLLAIRLVKMWNKPVKIVAFGSHVQADRLQAARVAGADIVLARSAFVKQLPELLTEVGQKEKEASV